VTLSDIKLLLTDVDGVMTDGSIHIDSRGCETKRCHVRDGQAIVVAQRVGLRIGIITGRPSPVTMIRARELGIEFVEQCAAMNKVQSLENICATAGVEEHEVAYIGDDLADLPVLCRVGYPMTVADGAAEVRSVVKHTTKQPGGHAAVREAIEHVLKAQGKWEQVLEEYGL